VGQGKEERGGGEEGEEEGEGEEEEEPEPNGTRAGCVVIDSRIALYELLNPLPIRAVPKQELLNNPLLSTPAVPNALRA